MAQPLKDVFFQPPFFERLATLVGARHPAFDRRRFLADVFDDDWATRELKGRLTHAAAALGRALPPHFPDALPIVLQIEGEFDGFDHLTFAAFVAQRGLDHPALSFTGLEQLTRTSAEFAIRPFIEAHPDLAYAQLFRWSAHESAHVRRLASEGCRPRLPWGTALVALKRDPSPILPILERLKDDESEYVRRSVANNLGDIAKDHPGLAVDLAARWLRESPDRLPLVKHALRDLLKKGHRQALALFGVGAKAAVTASRVAVVPARVPLGGRAVLHVTLVSTGRATQTVRLEYAMTYARPGGRTGRKVFAIGERQMEGGATVNLRRALDFQDRSIRKHYPGAHAVSVRANGREVGACAFTIVAPAVTTGRGRR